MARKKKITEPEENFPLAEISTQPITETIEKNYMPYVMSVIISRAIPEIDGFKPSHRKLLYTMYKMNLMNGPRTKSTNVVGATMTLNPHGDSSIYETMVRMTTGHAALLHPFIDSKGTWGLHSTNMEVAASRYTEVKLAKICAEIFGGINKNAVDLVDNYDATQKEPLLLPVSFPNILVSSNLGIAVGMASNICSFNLSEICDGTIELLKNSHISTDRMLDIIKAPDFPGGGFIIYNRDKMKELYETGKGTVKIRAKYEYDKDNNCINITEIPFSTSIELIMKKIADLIKEGKLKEITDYRDEIGIEGFRFTLDLRRGVDPETLMLKLFKLTPLEDNMGCNFNVLINGTPKVLGIIGILSEWINFRVNCLRREFTFDLNAKKDKLELLRGLGKILLDIDKAIKIVRETSNDADVVPNLAKAFDLTMRQAEYVAEIKLRNLNKEYILNRIEEIESLQKEIADLEETIGSDRKIKDVIIKQLKAIKDKYGIPRKSLILAQDDIQIYKESENIENFNIRAVFTKEGYFKKCTLVSLRASDEQMLKDGDRIILSEEGENRDSVVFFSDKAQAYKAKLADFDCLKASVLGDYVPSKLSFDAGEKAIFMKLIPENFEPKNLIFIFENGKGVKISMKNYETKSNRRKLTGAYSTASPIVGIFYEDEPFNLILVSDNRRAIMISTKLIPEKSTRSAGGVTLFNIKKNQKIAAAFKETDAPFENTGKYRKIKIPATGTLLEQYDIDARQIGIE
ncbi:MAG: topoisomerase IV [Clostridia bacterium]|nr:topoisomerase IV [Clostridia bacterium]